MSGTTAVLPVPVSCWSGSGARVVCQVFWFCSVGCGVTVLLVGEGVSGKDWDVFCRSTDGLVRCPFGGCMRRVQASCSGRASVLRCGPSGPGPTGP